MRYSDVHVEPIFPIVPKELDFGVTHSLEEI